MSDTAHLLPKINRYANGLLALSHNYAEADEPLCRLKKALRITCLLQKIGDKPVIAVCGLQGAGKSTLAGDILNVSASAGAWLPKNLGRGELTPVLVTQDEQIEAPYGIIHRFGSDREVSVKGATFGELRIDDPKVFAERTRSPEPDDVLPELRIPRSAGTRLPATLRLLILPGFEDAGDDLELSYRMQVVEEALAASIFGILVVDPSQSATSAQELALTKFARDFGASRPLVVLSHADTIGDSINKHVELLKREHGFRKNDVLTRGSYASADVMAAQTDRIIDAIHARWKEDVDGDLNRIKRRNAAISKVGRICADLRTIYSKRDRADLGLKEREVDDLILKFDEGADSLRRTFSKLLADELDAACGVATRSMQEDAAGRHVFDKMGEMFSDWVNGGPEPLELIKTAERHWADSRNYGELLLDIQKKSVSKRLFISGATSLDGKGISYGEHAKLPARSEIKPAHMALLAKDSPTTDDFESATRVPGLKDAVALIPVYALESQRLLARASTQTDGKKHAKDIEQIWGDFLDLEKGLGGDKKHIIGSLAKFTALACGIDVAVDGQFDMLHDLVNSVASAGSGTSAAGGGVAGATASTATVVAAGVGAAVAAAMLYGHLARSAWQLDMRKRDIVEQIIRNIRDAHEGKMYESFAELMDTMREATLVRLRHMYGLNQAEDVRVRRQSLLAAIESSMDRVALLESYVEA